MFEITFMYKDEASHWEWREQTGVYDSVKACIEMNGLGIDCDYRIINVEEI